MTLQKTFCLLALAGVAFVPLAASAAYDYSGSGSAGVQVQTASPAVDVNAGAQGSAGATNGSDGDTSTSSEPVHGMNGDTDTGLTGGMHTNGLGLEITTSAQVTSEDDLKVFSENLQARDENVAEANADASGSADLTYYHRGRLFGFIPVRVKTHTWVTSAEDGSVKVNTTLPWWSAFVAGTGKVRSQVDEELSSSTSVSADVRASADASARARVLEAIARAHAALDAQASASAN